MTTPDPVSTSHDAVENASHALDRHVADVIAWHFSPASGCPFWLNWAESARWSPIDKVQGIDDLQRFPHFDDAWLRDVANEQWVPQALGDRPFKVFETGGTTGLPKQRVSWEDHLTDYTEFSEGLDDGDFPKRGNWLMVGPTGPRRLRLSIEHLANIRGGSCYFVDLDPRWVKKLIARGDYEQATAYRDHVIEQAVELLKHRAISCLFTTPKLLEDLGEALSLPNAGITGVFCGGTTMTPQMVRFLIEEVLENRAAFVPTYGNTLMGLARSKPLRSEDRFSVTYYAPQPRAVLRVIDPDHSDRLVAYGSYGRVELSTLTREFFMPRFLERDEAIRRPPCEEFPWDGVGDVRPFGVLEKKIVEGVY